MLSSFRRLPSNSLSVFPEDSVEAEACHNFFVSVMLSLAEIGEGPSMLYFLL